MDWKIMLAYVTGSVDEELLRRNEYLVAENRILRAHTPGRVKLSDGFPREKIGRTGPVRCRERLGGLLKFYHRAAA